MWPMPRANRKPGKLVALCTSRPNPLLDSPTGRLAEAPIEGPRRRWACASHIQVAPALRRRAVSKGAQEPVARCLTSTRVARTALGPRSRAARGRRCQWARETQPHARASVGIMHLGQLLHSKPHWHWQVTQAGTGRSGAPGPSLRLRPGTLTGDV
jgi:hypothetical protein